MAVIVTGGAGFLGSHLVDSLVQRGEHVFVIDNLMTGKLANLESSLSTGNATFIFGDVACSKAELIQLLAPAIETGITQIYHLASPASPDAYGNHPWMTLAVNGAATMHLIEIALKAQALFFFASTSEVYGDPLIHPQPETYFGNVNSVGPRACYDEGKRFGEAAVSVAMREYGLKGRIMRVFNCYGPRMDIGDGRVVPAFLEALGKGQPFPIHGSGTQTRCLTYVTDLVKGIHCVVNHNTEAALPVNLGAEDERSVVEIGQELAKIAGVEFTADFREGRPEDPKMRRPDTKLATSLGWTAETRLSDGLKKTLEWFNADRSTYA